MQTLAPPACVSAEDGVGCDGDRHRHGATNTQTLSSSMPRCGTSSPRANSVRGIAGGARCGVLLIPTRVDAKGDDSSFARHNRVPQRC